MKYTDNYTTSQGETLPPVIRTQIDAELAQLGIEPREHKTADYLTKRLINESLNAGQKLAHKINLVSQIGSLSLTADEFQAELRRIDEENPKMTVNEFIIEKMTEAQ